MLDEPTRPPGRGAGAARRLDRPLVALVGGILGPQLVFDVVVLTAAARILGQGLDEGTRHLRPAAARHDAGCPAPAVTWCARDPADGYRRGAAG